jgi:hypothetical protein
MTEAEWLEGANPLPMLEFLGNRVSERKLRLFVVACCREVSDLLSNLEQVYGDGRCRIQLGEAFADGLATREEVLGGLHDGGLTDSGASPDGHLLTYVLPGLTATDVHQKVLQAVQGTGLARRRFVERLGKNGVIDWHLPPDRAKGQVAHLATYARLCHWLRDIVGNPFRPTPDLNSSWLVQNDRTVRRLAETIYDEHAFDRLPILADALEDTGCDSAALLDHCRLPGEHGRGCWVVDLLLGKP